MRYLLRKNVLAAVPEVEISACEFAELKAARVILLSAFAIEEKYEIVISNFLDLEKQLLDIAATNTVRDTLSYAEFFDVRSVLNIRLVNLLTATRLYLDHLPQHIADFLPKNPDAGNLVKSKCSEEYDKHFEYRFMEALRNYVQHRGIPIHFVQQGSRWTSLEGDGLLEYYVHISVQRSYLEEDGKFKKTVLSEISKDIDLTAASRRYIESISSIHEFSRDLVTDSVTSARSTIESAHSTYSKVYSESLIGLSALEMNERQEVSSVPLLLDWDDVRIQLQQRNKKLVNLAKRYVTSRIAE